ncbi:cellulose binding domain-containing protein [Microbispora amethystogenes]|uniref:cellulose binding domain-containing protein n=1 Tax=Microbispora amethystogenes TaxID=1427754 RepID=UPI003400A93B
MRTLSRLSWSAAWAAAGAVAAALLAVNIAAPPVLAGSAAESHAVRAMTTVSPTSSPSPGADVTPPTAPGDLRACPPPPPPSGSFQGVVGLCWTASSDATGVTEYRVFMLTGNGFLEVASTSSTTAVVPGLVHGRTYTFYVVARDAAGNTSQPSALLSTPAVSGVDVTPTPATGDTTPPTRPTGMQADCLPDFNGTSFCWTPSTDDVGVAGYDVYRRTGSGWARAGRDLPSTARSFSEAGFNSTPGQQYMYFAAGQSYVYFVVAKDAAGNLSLPSDLVTATVPVDYPTHSPSPVSCKIEYTAWSWSGGFSATVKITNLGQTPMNDWTLRFAFPDAGQKVAQGYSATWSQSGKDVTAVNLSWNKMIDPGKSVLIGFTGRQTGANPDPAAFTLNNRTCVKS